MTRMTALRSTSALLLLLASGCDGAPAVPDDGGTDASVAPDAHVPSDAGEAGPCTDVSVATWRLDNMDDVSIRYRARITPHVGGDPWDLYLEFNRYDTDYVGEFPLGEGPDASYGSCAHCVMAMYGTNFEEVFFASAGTLVLREDPFDQKLDATLRDVVLVESMIVGPTLESVPVPGGACLALAETTVTATFPSPGWRCPAEQFDDGATCHCSCGAPDPDCNRECPLPPDPACDPTPLPIAGCAAGDLCTWEGECAATCDHEGRVPCATGGVCGFSSQGDRCFDPSDAGDHVDGAALGADCAEGNLYCGIDGEGFAQGLCDADEDWLCRPTCGGDEDCTVEGEICWTLIIETASGAGYGFCRPAPPPCQEAGTTCTDHLDCCTVLCEGLGVDGATEGTCA